MSYWPNITIAAIGLSTLVRLYLRHKIVLAGSPTTTEEPITLDLNQDRYTFYTPSAPRVFTPAQASELGPNILSAAWYAEEIRYDELPQIATRLLERGFDTPSVRRVAGEQPHCRADMSEMAGKMFSELGAGGEYTREQALKVICLAVATEVRRGTRKPADAVLTVSSLYDWRAHEPVTQIILLNYAYEHLLDDDPIASFSDLDAQARAAFAELESKLTQDF